MIMIMIDDHDYFSFVVFEISDPLGVNNQGQNINEQEHLSCFNSLAEILERDLRYL